MEKENMRYMTAKADNMFKLIGIIIMMIGVIGLLFNWNLSYSEKNKKLKAFEELMTQTIFRLERENIRLCDFFEEVNTGNSQINKGCKEISEMLREHQVSSVAQAWKTAWKSKLVEWGLKAREREMILNFANIYLAGDLDEIMDKAQAGREDLNILRKQEQNSYEQKKKILFPVGMLSALMVIIILI